MKTPKSWNLVAFIGILLTVISFIIIGSLGYWAFGENVNINFFENLPKSIYINAEFHIN
jgi:amino acid permease